MKKKAFVGHTHLGWFAYVGKKAEGSKYLRHDGSVHYHMTGQGGTYFDTKEEAEALAERYNTPNPKMGVN